MSQTTVPLGAFYLNLDRPLGRGGMARVYQGHHRDGHPVAVKILIPAKTGQERYYQSFRTEAQAMASLDHPHAARIFDIGQLRHPIETPKGLRFDVDSPYLIMEHMAGGTLASLKRRIKRWKHARQILFELLDALAHAHARGVIHRDIKPSNVMRATPIGQPARWSLVDFGVAHAVDTLLEEESESMIAGTPEYMAPEQFTGRWQDYGPWTDLYALGCLAYELVGGSVPFDAPRTAKRANILAMAHLTSQRPELQPRFTIPSGLTDWIMRLMSIDPLDRFQCAADAAWALHTLEPNSGPIHATPSYALQGPFDSPPPQEDARLQGVGLGVYAFKQTPLVGRQTQQKMLWQALGALQEPGPSQAIMLLGPEGVGKSFLAQWLCQRAVQTGLATVLKATHDPRPNTNNGLHQMLARALRVQRMGPESIQKRLSHRLEHLGIDDPHNQRVLTQLLCEPTQSSRTTGGHSTLSGRYAAIERLLQALSAQRPVILWIDDAHAAADALSLAHHLHTQRDPRRHGRLLIILSGRHNTGRKNLVTQALLNLFVGLPRVTKMALKALAPKAHAELVHALLPLSPSLAQQVQARTAGNPLFAIELVDDWIQRGLLDAGPKGFVLKEDTRPTLPDDIYALWVSRLRTALGGMPPTAHKSLFIAATLGHHIDEREWLAACQHSNTTPPPTLLSKLYQHNLARQTPDGWRFEHRMLAEALLRQTDELRFAAQAHTSCAWALNHIHPAPDLTTTERLGTHLQRAGQPHQAFDALSNAIEGHIYAGSYHRALELHAECQGLLDALALPEHDARHGLLLAQHARSLDPLGRQHEIQDQLRPAIALARQHNWPSLPQLLQRLAKHTHTQNGPEETIKLLEEAAALLHQSGDIAGLSSVHTQLAQSMAIAIPERALRHAQRSLQHAQEVGSALLISIALDTMAHCHRGLDCFEEALECSRRAEESAQGLGHPILHAVILNTLGLTALEQERWDVAERAFRQCAAALRAAASSQDIKALINLARVLPRQNRLEELSTLLDELSQHETFNDDIPFRAMFHALAMEVAAHRRQSATWDQHLDQLRLCTNPLVPSLHSTATQLLHSATRMAPQSTSRAHDALMLAHRIARTLNRREVHERLNAALQHVRAMA